LSDLKSHLILCSRSFNNNQLEESFSWDPQDATVTQLLALFLSISNGNLSQLEMPSEKKLKAKLLKVKEFKHASTHSHTLMMMS
jgi:hypothetical protein